MLETMPTQIQMPTQVPTQLPTQMMPFGDRWVRKSIIVRFGGYLLAWLAVCFVVDAGLVALCYVLPEGLEAWLIFGAMTVSGQVVLAPVVAGVPTVTKARMHPVAMAYLYALVGLPATFVLGGPALDLLSHFV